MTPIRMRLFEISNQVRASPSRRWAVAVGAFAVALYTRFLCDHLLPPGFPYLTFFPAVILTTFLAGVLPGTVCAVACGLAAWYWFIPPFGFLELNGSVLVALTFYAFVVSVDILLIQVMHRAVDGLQDERLRSEDLVREQQRLLAEQKERERQQRVLQWELSHRMKNTLAMVQAVVSQSLRNATDIKVAGELAFARIEALARASDALTATDWSAADVETIVKTSIAPHQDSSDRFDISGPPMVLEAQPALGLALEIHELATNATKYGALNTPSGRITIRWEAPSDRGFAFTWSESGGPSAKEPASRGFGSRLTERVVPTYFSGKAKTDFRPEGIEYRLVGTVPAVTSDIDNP
jgi:two-component sensor histidine kinase